MFWAVWSEQKVADFLGGLYITDFIIAATDVKPAAVLTLQRKILSELDGGFLCQKLFFPLSSPPPPLPPPLVLWANFCRQRGTRGMSLLTARCGAEWGEDDEGWREKTDNTSLCCLKLSVEELQKPSAFFSRLKSTGSIFVRWHIYLLPRLQSESEVILVVLLFAHLITQTLNFRPWTPLQFLYSDYHIIRAGQDKLVRQAGWGKTRDRETLGNRRHCQTMTRCKGSIVWPKMLVYI